MNNIALVFEERHRRRQGNQGRGKLKIAHMVKLSIPANIQINATLLTATAVQPRDQQLNPAWAAAEFVNDFETPGFINLVCNWMVFCSG